MNRYAPLMLHPEDAAFLYANDLLDPEDALEFEQRHGRAAAAREVTPLPASPWRIPPPRMGFDLQAGRRAAFAERSTAEDDRLQVRIGDSFQLICPSIEAPEHRLVVLLRRIEGEDWTVQSPARPAQLIHLSQLPREPDGTWRLDLRATGPAGLQRWALALPSDDLPIDWLAPPEQRWAALQRGIASASVPTAALEIVTTDR